MRTGTFAILAILAAAVRLHAACPDMPTFTPGHYGVDGVDPFVSVIRDLNGDGKGDLVVFYGSSSGFQVFLGSATGVLTPTPLQFPSFFSNGRPALGDLNGDGKVDIAADTNFPNSIRLFYGVGDGTFTSGPTLALPPAESAFALRVVDLDQDGLSDVVVATTDASFNGHLLFYRQTSPGIFSMLTVAPLSGESIDMEVGDIDGDGKLDVAVVSAVTTNELNVFFGNGNGTFAAPVTVDLGAQFLVDADSIVIHDFNFDGRLDLAVGVVNRGIQILRNNGDRTFSFAQLIPEPQGGSVRVADFNYDGVPDLFASGYGGFYVVLANADGTFRTPQFTAIPAFNTLNSYALGDFRGLHRVDVATARFGFPHPQTVEVDLNDCGPPPLITSVTPSSGPAGGGNSVQLHGDNFFVPQQVLFGTTQATITASTPTLVTVTAPLHGPAIVPVSVSTPDGTATLNNAYAFVGPSSTSVVVEPFIAASRPFNITAIVNPTPGGGTVTFSIDGNAVGTANVVGNSATIGAVAPAMLGPHTIGAQFNGVVIFTPSSASVVVTVVADVPALSPPALAMVAAFMAVCGAIALRTASR
jgi:hypothetical protein